MNEIWVLLHSGSSTDPWATSGVPHGLVSGLAPHVEVARVDINLPYQGALNRIAAKIPGYTVMGSDAMSLVRARDARLRRNSIVRNADVVISMGSASGYRISAREQFRVQYEDMTVAQSPLPGGAAKDRWIRRQRRLYDQVDLCCVMTGWAADSLREHYDVPDAKIEVVGLGANALCKPAAKDWAHPNYLWVGVDWHRKGGDVLLAAWDRAGMSGAVLNVVGRHPDSLPATVIGHGIVRERERLRKFFEEATVFVLPSRFEAAGIVFLEAASAGTPCIGTSVGGLPYTLGPSGMVIPPSDVDALTEALVSMSDPAVASRFVEPAIRHAANFTWEAVAQRIFDAISERRSTARRPIA